jgi:hypothetical protein
MTITAEIEMAVTVVSVESLGVRSWNPKTSVCTHVAC